MEDLASRDAIRLVFGITRSVKAAIAIKLPIFSGNSFDIDGDATPDQLEKIVMQSKARSAVFDILTNGVPVSIAVKTRWLSPEPPGRPASARRPPHHPLRGHDIMRKTDVIIIGGGQAGLAMSRSLALRGVDHVVLERGRIAERWHSERWRSLHLLTTNAHERSSRLAI